MHDLGRVDARVERHDIVAHFQRHHDLFKGRVPRALAQTIDCAFDLACAPFDSRKGVRRRHAKVVMAMRCKDHLVSAWNFGNQHPDDVGAFARCCVSNSVRDIDRRRTCFDGGFNNAF